MKAETPPSTHHKPKESWLFNIWFAFFIFSLFYCASKDLPYETILTFAVFQFFCVRFLQVINGLIKINDNLGVNKRRNH